MHLCFWKGCIPPHKVPCLDLGKEKKGGVRVSRVTGKGNTCRTEGGIEVDWDGGEIKDRREREYMGNGKKEEIFV